MGVGGEGRGARRTEGGQVQSSDFKRDKNPSKKAAVYIFNLFMTFMHTPQKTWLHANPISD